MEGKCVEELVRNDHGVRIRGRRDLVNGVVPFERASVFLRARRKPGVLKSAQRRTGFDQMDRLQLVFAKLRHDLRQTEQKP